MSSSEFKKNLFEVNNARTQSIQEVVRTFVPPSSFARLVSAKNHILLGSRGSGKTAVLRMLAHNHLSSLDDEDAREVISARRFVGTYIAMRAEWVSTLKNKPWLNEQEMEQWFQWRLNISSCSAFIDTIRSCLDFYIKDEDQRTIEELHISRSVGDAWSEGQLAAKSLQEVREFLEDVEWERQVFMNNQRGQSHHSDRAAERPGKVFETELFSPFKRAIELLRRRMQFPESTLWAVCLDELEFLDLSHHRILNSHLRSYAGKLVFKLSTMPYFHHTLETNTATPLVHGHDFEYVYLDADPDTHSTDKDSWVLWAERIIGKKMQFSHREFSNRPLSFAWLLGDKSPLLDDKPSSWSIDSPMMALLRKYSTQETIDRAEKLANSGKFKDQISRKMHSMLLLRHGVGSTTGNARHDLYSGPKLVVRCTDANPRQLIRLFNELTIKNPRPDALPGEIHRPSPRQQTKILIQYSNEALHFAACEERIGEELVGFLERLGQYFQHRLHSQPLSTDYYYSIRIDHAIDPEIWKLVKTAVGIGLLFPKVSFQKPELLPVKSGEFNLAFRLAPAFALLPRRGKSVSLAVASQANHWPRQKQISNSQYSLKES